MPKPKKGVTPPHLTPMEPTALPKEMIGKQKPEVQALLKKLLAARKAGDKNTQRSLRKELRAAGFSLKSHNGGAPKPKARKPKAKTTPTRAEDEATLEAGER